MPLLTRPNEEWSIDFVSDALGNARAIRALTVSDGFTKEPPVIVERTGAGQAAVSAIDLNRLLGL